MNFNRYCRHCGSKVKMIDGEPVTYKCICHHKPLQSNEVMVGYTMEARIVQLKAMHELMRMANDEEIYMIWAYTMPDCPSEDDFKGIALDDEAYNECFDEFVRLITRKGNRY